MGYIKPKERDLVNIIEGIDIGVMLAKFKYKLLDTEEQLYLEELFRLTFDSITVDDLLKKYDIESSKFVAKLTGDADEDYLKLAYIRDKFSQWKDWSKNKESEDK